MSVVSVVCCQVQVLATSWSLVQRSPTDFVCRCVWSRNHKIPREWGGRKGPLGGYRAKRKNISLHIQLTAMTSHYLRHGPIEVNKVDPLEQGIKHWYNRHKITNFVRNFRQQSPRKCIKGKLQCFLIFEFQVNEPKIILIL